MTTVVPMWVAAILFLVGSLLTALVFIAVVWIVEDHLRTLRRK